MPESFFNMHISPYMKRLRIENKERPVGKVKWVGVLKSRGKWAGHCDRFGTWVGHSYLRARKLLAVQLATYVGLETRLGGAGLVNAGLTRDNFSVFLPSVYHMPYHTYTLYSNSSSCLLYFHFSLHVQFLLRPSNS